jgi:hypothetical protein
MKKNWFVLIALTLMVVFGVGTVCAETHSRFITGFPVYQPKDGEVFIISNTLDFSDLKTQGVYQGGTLNGVSRSDTVKLLPIPAGTIVKSVGVYISSAWSTSGVTCYGATIGDSSSTNGWLKAIDFGPSASGVSTSVGTSSWTVDGGGGVSIINAPTYAYTGGKYYSTASTIDAVIPATSHQTYAKCTDFVMKVWAECVNPRSQKAYKRTGN